MRLIWINVSRPAPAESAAAPQLRLPFEAAWEARSLVRTERPKAADDSRGLLLFIAQEPESPFYYRLFGSDGTEAGTHRLLRVNLGSSFYPFLHPALVNGLRFFFVDPLDEVERVELWSTDGTPEGTRAVEPADGVHPAAPFDLMAFDSGLYFFADAEAGTNPGRALWRSDGTPGSTRLFAHLAPPREQGFEVSSQPTVLHGRLYFVADDGQAGAELWSTDGTPEGTKIVLDLRPGPRGARIAHLTAAGGRLSFSADDGLDDHARELASGERFVEFFARGAKGTSDDVRRKVLGKRGSECWARSRGERAKREPVVRGIERENAAASGCENRGL